MPESSPPVRALKPFTLLAALAVCALLAYVVLNFGRTPAPLGVTQENVPAAEKAQTVARVPEAAGGLNDLADHTAAENTRKPGLASAVPTMQADIPPGMIALADLNHSDRFTPVGSMHGLLWAVTTGDVQALQSAIMVDPTALDTAREYLSRTTARELSPEEAVTMLLTAHIPQVNAVDEAKTEPRSDGSVSVTLRMMPATGKESYVSFRFLNTSDGWRAHIPKSMFNAMIRTAGEHGPSAK